MYLIVLIYKPILIYTLLRQTKILDHTHCSLKIIEFPILPLFYTLDCMTTKLAHDILMVKLYIHIRSPNFIKMIKVLSQCSINAIICSVFK